MKRSAVMFIAIGGPKAHVTLSMTDTLFQQPAKLNLGTGFALPVGGFHTATSQKVSPQGLLRTRGRVLQPESYGDRRHHLYGLAVQQRRLITPLPDCVDGCLGEIRVGRTDDLPVQRNTFHRDYRLQQHCSLDAAQARTLRVVRLPLLDEFPCLHEPTHPYSVRSSVLRSGAGPRRGLGRDFHGLCRGTRLQYHVQWGRGFTGPRDTDSLVIGSESRTDHLQLILARRKHSEGELADIISDSHASDDTVFIHDVDYSVGHPRSARVENNAGKAWCSLGWIAPHALAYSHHCA